MPLSSGIQHRLYLKQNEFLKNNSFDEIVPANFTYQDVIVISSGTADKMGQRVVFQTYSCGCGPGPLVRGAFLLEEVGWTQSKFQRMLAASDNPKEVALAAQNIFATVKRIRRASTDEEKRLIENVLQLYFGDKRKIHFF